jgi:cell division protein FtsW
MDAARAAESRNQATGSGTTQFRGLPDLALTFAIMALALFGLVAVFSASAPEALQKFNDLTWFFRRQAIACVIGYVAMNTLSRIDYRRLRKWDWTMYAISLVLLALTLVPALSVRWGGSSRWLPLGPVQFEPSELCKVACIILMASGLSRYKWSHWSIWLRALAVILVTLIVMKQPDLGTSMIISGTMVVLMSVAGMSWWLVTAAVPVLGFVLWKHVTKTPYQMARIQSWLNPYSSPQKEGWNIIQSVLAIGSGGLFGAGFGGSMQKLYYLPVQHADFIFAVIAEELGLAGCLALLALFTFFAYCGFNTALTARTLFGRFLAIGITVSIALQAVVNISVTAGVIPVTGITLPFISYGCSSLIITFAMAGILLSISRDRKQPYEDEEVA